MSKTIPTAGRHSQNLYKSFGVLLILLLLLTGFAIQTYRQSIEANRWNIHTFRVMLEVRGFSEALFTFDSGLRAYANTQDRKYLVPLRTGKLSFENRLKRARQLTVDRPEQQGRLLELEKSFATYLTQHAEPLIRFTNSAPNALVSTQEALIGAVARRAVLERARYVISEMEAFENRLLVSRGVEQNTLQRRSLWALWLGGVFSVATVAALMSIAVRGAGNLASANGNLAKSNQLLEESNSSLEAVNLQMDTSNVILATTNARLEAEVEERTRTERKLNVALEDLKRSNLDLEQFAYVASHDLQEPLRAVSGCVQVLKRRYQDKLDARAEQLISHSVDGAHRMQQLIDDLLTYSRLGTHGAPFGSVSLEGVLEDVMRSVAPSLRESSVKLTWDPLPVVRGDARQIEQVLQNLISNANKFRAEQNPCIHVGCQTVGAVARISVADNGPGIAPEYFERIFVMFQRLHTRAEYPGTGIGLAVCKKVIERHGGRIWVESEVGQGTTFYFEIPLAPGVEVALTGSEASH